MKIFHEEFYERNLVIFREGRFFSIFLRRTAKILSKSNNKILTFYIETI